MARQQSPQPVSALPQESFSDPNGVHGFAERDQLIRMRQVCDVVALSKAHIFRLVANRKFPQPVRLGAKATRWSAREVAAWVEQQLAGRAS